MVPLNSIDLGKVVQEWRDVSPPANDDDKQISLGEICFSLRYVPNTGKLTVCILEAKNLKQMDLGGFSGKSFHFHFHQLLGINFYNRSLQILKILNDKIVLFY